MNPNKNRIRRRVVDRMMIWLSQRAGQQDEIGRERKILKDRSRINFLIFLTSLSFSFLSCLFLLLPFSFSFFSSFFCTFFLIALGGAGCNRTVGFPINGGLRHDLLQGVGFSTNCLEQRRSIYSASSFIEPVATSLQINVHPLSSSPRASQRGLDKLLLFSPMSLGKFGET